MNSLFIALPLSKVIKDQVQRLCFGLPHVRWIQHFHFHLTLLYIGAVEGSAQLDIQEALSKIQIAPFNLSLKGAGFFPLKKNQGVIWAGISASEELENLKKTIDKQLKEFLPQFNRKPFTPHITLGYFENIDKLRLIDYLEIQSHFSTNPFINESFVLMKSYQSQESPIYQELMRYALISPVNKLKIL